MSFGFSLADIVKGAEFCRWIVDHCIDKTNTANVRYKQLEHDIKGLENSIERLVTTFDGNFPDQQPIRDLKDLIGDFYQTLEECQLVLKSPRFVGLRTSGAGFVQNVAWAASSQEKVDALRRRIQFHTQKIYLIIEPVKLGLLSTMGERLDEITAILRANFPQPYPLDPVPEWLSVKLEQTIMENPPAGFTGLHNLPMQEGFDLLYSFFRESTWAFRDAETADETVEQYLNLLKAQWILETIKKGEDFRRAWSGSLFKWTIAEIEQRIIAQYRRADLVRFDDNQIGRLGPASFRIWPVREAANVAVLTDPSISEEEILRLSLLTDSPSNQDYMVVFRIGHDIRIARYIVPAGVGTTPYFESETFNPHTDRFIPYYAIQESVSLATQRRGSFLPYSAAVCRGNITGQTSYSVKGPKDMWNLQRAVTGYQVVFDMNTTWLFNQEMSPYQDVRLKGRSKMQIWHWKPLPPKIPEDDGSDSCSLSTVSPASIDSLDTLSSGASVADIILGGTDISNVTIDHHTPNESTLVARTPPLPVFMIFTRTAGKYRYVHFELVQGLDIAPSACRCNTDSKCLRVVIQPGKDSPSKSFSVRVFSVDTEQINSWNLSIFGHPRHPELDSHRNVKRIKCRFLNVDFETLENKNIFVQRFQDVSKLRNNAAATMHKIRQRTQSLAEDTAQIHHRRGSSSSSFSNSSRPSISSASSSVPTFHNSRASSSSAPSSAPTIHPLSSASSMHLSERFSEPYRSPRMG